MEVKDKPNISTIVELDSFGKQVATCARNLPGFPVADTTLIAGVLPNFSSELLEKIRDNEKSLCVIYWNSKIYSYYRTLSSSHNCLACLLASMHRILDVTEESIANKNEDDIFVSRNILFPINAINTSLLVSCQYLKGNIHGFIDDNKVIIHSLLDGSLLTECFYTTSDCKFCSNFKQFPLELNSMSEQKNAYSATRQYPIGHFSSKIEDFCAKNLGLIGDIANDLQLPVASTTANLILSPTKHELTLGRSRDFTNSKTIAIAESLERLCGLQTAENLSTLKASYNQISHSAINPQDYCLHFDAQYQLPDFPFVQFERDLILDWVKGIELSSQREIYIPTSMVYYGYKHSKTKPMLAFETSNGCAIGASYAEAVLAGLFEVIERDAFLLTWYQQQSIPNITDFVLEYSAVRALYNKMVLFCGAEIIFFNSTRKHGVPTVFAVIYSNDKTKPRYAAAAGVGLTFSQAAESALYELSCHYIRLLYLLAEKGSRGRAYEMLTDPYKVEKMEDHALVNALPEAEERFAFLLDSQLMNNKDELFGYEIRSAQTPYQSLNIILKKLMAYGFDVVVADQTLPILKSKNLYCVKVLVKDMLPITFGHNFIRLNNTEFLSSNGCSIDNMSNIFPHPFP